MRVLRPILTTSLLLTAFTASTAVFAQADPRAVLEEINLARTQPSRYAVYLEQMLPLFSGNDYRRPGKITMRTREGAAAVQEAIRALRAQQPLAALAWSDELARAAADHARDQGPAGRTGHDGSDGSTMRARIERYARWGGSISENIEYGSETAREVVIALIVDDGVGGRGHRHNIFDARMRFAGVGCGTHQQYRTTCVIDHAGEITPLGGTPASSAQPSGKPGRAAPRGLPQRP